MKIDGLNRLVSRLEKEKENTTKTENQTFLEGEIVGVEQAIDIIVTV
ncbi:MAG: hypothetical protein ACOCRO_09195 [Halanaerobiales bacterium]